MIYNDDKCALIVDLSRKVKKGKEESLIYIEGMARKTKGCYDPSEQPFSYWHVSFTINDLRPTCQGHEHSLKGWVDPSPHDSLKDQIEPSPFGSFHLVITDPWSEGAIEEGENWRWQIYLDGLNDANKSCQIWTDHLWTLGGRICLEGRIAQQMSQ